MPVLGEGRTTRTTAVQLASRTDLELERLAAAIAADMAAASLAQDFEAAAWHRDELARVSAAQQARAGRE
jgi:excinuclease UvrABC nuclease subunit